jgi:Zn-dependent peptidase ImmA (M78 family)
MARQPPVARRRRALQSAADLLNELGIDDEQPVDVFGAIADLGLWLVFRKMDNLLGAVLSDGPGGIMITTERPTSIQRYTAAHEIGHLQLDHRAAFDTDDDVLRPSEDEREQLAQLFASYFLMPPPLVHTTANRHGVRSDTVLHPAQAYLVARDMGVSFEAALRQMANLDIITDGQRESLIDTSLLRAKEQVAHGHRPRDARADVWPVDEQTMHHRLTLTVNDEIIITLPENRTTGYRWLDDATNTARRTRVPRSAPPAFAAPPFAPTTTAVRPPTKSPQRSGADVTAALALLPPTPVPNVIPGDQPDAHDSGADDEDARMPVESQLVMVSDEYQPGWAPVSTHRAATLRRYIAGADTTSNFLTTSGDLNSTASPADPSAPGVGAAGRRWLALQAPVEGHLTYVLHYAAPHNPATPPAATFAVEATVTAPPEVLQRRALLAVDDDNGDRDEDDGTADPDAGQESQR